MTFKAPHILVDDDGSIRPVPQDGTQKPTEQGYIHSDVAQAWIRRMTEQEAEKSAQLQAELVRLQLTMDVLRQKALAACGLSSSWLGEIEPNDNTALGRQATEAAIGRELLRVLNRGK